MTNRAIQYHSIKASASLLGCSISQLYNYIAAERIVAVKLDGKTLIADDEIARFQSALPRFVSRMRVPGRKGDAAPMA